MKKPIIKTFKSFRWIICEEPNEENLSELFNENKIEDIELESVIKQDSRAKLDIYDHYTYLKLNFLKYFEKTDTLEINELHNIFWKDFLITISTYPTKKLNQVVDEYAGKDFEWDIEDLLYSILDRQIAKWSKIIDYIEEWVNILEKSAYDWITKNKLRLIAQKRKNITVLKHTLNVNITVLESLAKLLESRNSDLTTNYDYLVDKIHKSYQEVLILEESADGFDSTVRALFDIKNNEIIKRISIASFIFIPLNLVAGIFWMNLENIPFTLKSVVIIFICTFFFMVILGYIFRKYIFD